MRATLEHSLTEEHFAGMIELAASFTTGVQATLDEFNVAWSIQQLGARAEYRFTNPAPVNGTEAAAAHDDDLDEYMHLYLVNRGVLLTPFHNMALMCPTTTQADVDLHTSLFRQAVSELAS
jgi:glutamate-1-semialdehyde 2,1-aminomutase